MRVDVLGQGAAVNDGHTDVRIGDSGVVGYGSKTRASDESEMIASEQTRYSRYWWFVSSVCISFVGS